MKKKKLNYRRLIQKAVELYYKVAIPLTPHKSWKKSWREHRKEFLTNRNLFDKNLKRFKERFTLEGYDKNTYKAKCIEYILSYMLFCVTADEYFQYEFSDKGWLWRNHHITIERRNFIDSITNDAAVIGIVANKARFNEFYEKYIGRQWCDVKSVSDDTFKKVFDDSKRIIIKPRGRYGGIDIKAYYVADIDMKELHNKYVTKKGNYIAEEYLYQDGILHDINPSSLNTIRITTLRSGSDVEVIDGYYRCGCGSAVVDNFSSGGIIFPINIKNGEIYEGHSRDDIGIINHPISGIKVKGMIVPNWELIRKEIRDVHEMSPKGLELVGWDICVVNGKMILIEGNSKPGYTTLYDSNNKLWQKFKKRFGNN